MQNSWFCSDHDSGKIPPSSAACGSPLLPLHPPDPPDLNSPLSLSHFPPLSPSPSKLSSTKNLIPLNSTISGNSTVPPTPAPCLVQQTVTDDTVMIPATHGPTEVTISNSSESRSESVTVHRPFKTLPPKHNPPIHPNRASNLQPATSLPPLIPNLPASSPQSTKIPSPNHNQNHFIPFGSFTQIPTIPVSPLEAPPTSGKSAAPPTLVEKLRRFEDKTLRRIAPITYSESGRPRVLIPDSVFEKGAELHKDFIICYFNGRPPPFLRQKILEKGVWYVGDSMFTTAQWNSSHSANKTPAATMQIWAHLHGVPLDPWLPPTCSHCHELGHIVRNCLLLPQPPKPPTTAPS